MLKYDPDLYINSGIYDGDMDSEYDHTIEKIVKCRKPHTCPICQKTIQPGEQAIYEKAFGDEGPVSCYTCIPCIEEWLKESGQVESEDEEDES